MEHYGSLELDSLRASVGASADHVSGLRAEGVLAILGQGDDGEEVKGYWLLLTEMMNEVPVLVHRCLFALPCQRPQKSHLRCQWAFVEVAIATVTAEHPLHLV
jgi:hypothetical protein